MKFMKNFSRIWQIEQKDTIKFVLSDENVKQEQKNAKNDLKK